MTKLGRLVKAGKINSMEEIYLHSLPIKEFQIVDNFLPKLKDEVMKVRKRLAPLDVHSTGIAVRRRRGGQRRGGSTEWTRFLGRVTSQLERRHGC